MDAPFSNVAEEPIHTLAGLTDVNVGTASEGHELRYNATTGVFESAIPHSVFDSTKENLSAGTSFPSDSTGSNNTALGAQSMKSVTSGGDNVCVGHESLEALTEGNDNVAVGKRAGTLLTTGSLNTFVGDHAGRNMTGSQNTCIGAGAGVDFVSGDRNILIGKDTGADAGAGNGTGSNCLIIGNGVPAVQNDRMLLLFNGELTSGHLPSSLIGDNVMVLGGANITDAVLCGGSLPTSSSGRKLGALFTDANGFVKSNIASPNAVQTITQPTSTLDTLKVQCTNGDCVLKLSSEVDGNDATLTASHTDNSLTIAATQSANIVFKTNGSEGMAVMSNQDVRFKNFIRWTGTFSNVAAAGTPATRSMAWIGNDLGVYDTTNGWRKISTESF